MMSRPTPITPSLITLASVLWGLIVFVAIVFLNLSASTNEPLILGHDGRPYDATLMWQQGFPLIGWEREVAYSDGTATSELIGGKVSTFYFANLAVNVAFALALIVFSCLSVVAALKNGFAIRQLSIIVLAIVATSITVFALRTCERSFAIVTYRLTDVAWQVVLVAIMLSWWNIIWRFLGGPKKNDSLHK
jgi:hypothetical protein